MICRRLVLSILAGTLAASVSGCGINGQVIRTEAPRSEDDEEKTPKRINNSESPTVLRWAGGDT